MTAALASQPERDERAAKLAALPQLGRSRARRHGPAQERDGVQAKFIAEFSNQEAEECALMALAFALNDEEEDADRASILTEKWWQEAALSDEEGDERAETAALSQETRGIECAETAGLSQERRQDERAEMAALSDHQEEMDFDAAVSVERAFEAAHQAQEEREKTFPHADVSNSGVEHAEEKQCPLCREVLTYQNKAQCIMCHGVYCN